MSNNDFEIAKSVIEAIPHMDEFAKGYFLGKAQGIIENAKQNEKVQEDNSEAKNE